MGPGYLSRRRWLVTMTARVVALDNIQLWACCTKLPGLWVVHGAAPCSEVCCMSHAPQAWQASCRNCYRACLK